jgi:hypothetical protein
MDKPWANLASRVVRILLARKGLKTGDVPALLKGDGEKNLEIDAQALSELIAKERIDLELFLRILLAIGDAVPSRWVQFTTNRKSDWKSLGASIVAEEVRNYPSASSDDIAQRMASMHRGASAATWRAKITEGDLSLGEFMLLLNEVGSTSLAQYLDWDDVVAAAQVTRKMMD